MCAFVCLLHLVFLKEENVQVSHPLSVPRVDNFQSQILMSQTLISLHLCLSEWSNIYVLCFFPSLSISTNQDFNCKLHTHLSELPLKPLTAKSLAQYSHPEERILTLACVGRGERPRKVMDTNSCYVALVPRTGWFVPSWGWRLLSLPISYLLSLLSNKVFNFFRRRISTVCCPVYLWGRH